MAKQTYNKYPRQIRWLCSSSHFVHHRDILRRHNEVSEFFARNEYTGTFHLQNRNNHLEWGPRITIYDTCTCKCKIGNSEGQNKENRDKPTNYIKHELKTHRKLKLNKKLLCTDSLSAFLHSRNNCRGSHFF